MSLLKVESLNIKSYSGAQLVKNVSFEMNAGETLVIIGESGSGKTLTSLAILDLLPSSVVKTSGSIWINKVKFIDSMRGSQISMVMQAPAACFDQVHSIRTIFTDTLKSHQNKQTHAIHSAVKAEKNVTGNTTRDTDKNADKSNVNSNTYQNKKIEISDEYLIEMIEAVELSNPLDLLDSFAFQLSGGTLQRLMIALNLALDPQIIIADEATSDIDIVAQSEILKLLSVMSKNGKGLLFITHDMSVAKQMADRIIVMKQGEIIDNFSIQDLHKDNRHEYTKQLLAAHANLNKNPWGINFTVE